MPAERRRKILMLQHKLTVIDNRERLNAGKRARYPAGSREYQHYADLVEQDERLYRATKRRIERLREAVTA